jgi:beta-N-acetylhexosaminidase
MTKLSRRRFLALGGQMAALGLGALWTRSVKAAGFTDVAPPDASLDYKIGQMFMLGFSGPSVSANSLIAADIRDRHVGGVLLFDSPGASYGNIQSSGQLKKLTAQLQALAAPTPLFVSVDQEGGNVARLKPAYGFAPTVSEQYLGSLNDLTTTRSYADTTAATLAEHGININLAPVVDLNINPNNPVIGAYGRSFSADPAIVTSQSEQVISTHWEHNVFCTLKHFPGHGSSHADSHLGFVDVTDTWSRIELEPYQEIIRMGLCDIVMTAHIFNANLDPDLPATLSHKIITGLLREELGFNGVVMTDDMQMKAISDIYTFDTALQLAVKAGVDIITIGSNTFYGPNTTAHAIAVIRQMVADGTIPAQRIDESYRRIMALKGYLSKT